MDKKKDQRFDLAYNSEEFDRKTHIRNTTLKFEQMRKEYASQIIERILEDNNPEDIKSFLTGFLAACEMYLSPEDASDLSHADMCRAAARRIV